MPNYKLIGKRIKETRKLCRISQAELAELTDLSVSYISHIENAKKKASLNSLIRISNVMGITLDSLLSGNQNNSKEEYQNDIWILTKDCTCFEKAIICEMILSLKIALRENNCLLRTDDEK